MNTSHNLPRRVIIAAALLANRYSNPDVAAYNRAGSHITGSKTRSERFWFRVGRALGWTGMTDYEIAVRSDIRRTQASFSA